MSHSEWGPAPSWHGSAEIGSYAVTLCAGEDLQPALEPVRQAVAGLGEPVEKRLADNALEFVVDCPGAAAWSLWQGLRRELDSIDVFVQPADKPVPRLLICDMDMTIVAAETLDEVAAALGMGDRIAAITARAMHGELDFNAALRERIAMLAGQPEQVFHDVARELEFHSGARELIAGANAAGVLTILISGGFAQVAEPVARQLDFDEVHCNRLEIENGLLTGRVVEPIVNAEVKRDTLARRAQTFGIDPAACCTIGDGANDTPMVENAGLGIAYRGKPVLRSATDCQLNHAGLEAALYFMRRIVRAQTICRCE